MMLFAATDLDDIRLDSTVRGADDGAVAQAAGCLDSLGQIDGLVH
jgi:hypothetical protein